MKLARLRIENYQGLNEIDIPLSRFICLIGENNCGKSSVLQAIFLFFSGSSLPRINYFDPSKNVRIELSLALVYWKHNSRQYHPDFVAETGDTIYMIETKKEGDIDTVDVQEKTQAALLYCKNATDFTTRNGGKPWEVRPYPSQRCNGQYELRDADKKVCHELMT